MERAVRVEPPHVHLGGFVGRAKHDRVGNAEHRLDLEPRGRNRLIVDQEAAGVGSVSDGEQAAARQPGRRPQRQIDPTVVVVTPYDLGRAQIWIDRQHLHRPLIARLHQRERWALRCPRHRRHVFESLAIPDDVDERSIHADHMQRHDRVGGAGLG